MKTTIFAHINKNFKIMRLSFLLAFMLIILASCNNENEVLLTTTYGDIEIRLYEETPKHKKNFTKLIKDNFYDDVLFHRVIKNFMIQGGDPNSKDAAPNDLLGGGGSGYDIDAEINSVLFHKKGAVAAARLGNDQNPEKKSSGSQFYIVQGRVFSNQELIKLEINRNKVILTKIIRDVQQKRASELKILNTDKEINQEAINVILEEIRAESNTIFRQQEFKFTDEQKEVYTTIGGAPHLDGEYTVFGEVVNGLDVVDAIATVVTDNNDRPIEDIKMSIKVK